MSDKVQKIKEEIERRIEKYGPDFKTPYDAMYQLLTLLDLINSLPEEPESEDLEEEIKRYSKNILILPLSGDRWQTMEITEGNWIDIARHFAEWQKQQGEKLFKDDSWNYIEENYPNISQEEKLRLYDISIKSRLAGANAIKQKMMKDAIDATTLDIDAQTIEFGLWPEKLLDIKEGDKVKIIVIKEN